MKKKIWDIPRSDLRDRCGKCLNTFGLSLKFKCRELKGSRYPKMCYTCKEKTYNNNEPFLILHGIKKVTRLDLTL